MKHKMLYGLLLALFIAGVSAGVACAQTNELKAPDNTASEPEFQWLWGEVISVDGVKNEIVVKYLDYEADAEKEMVLSVDDKTTFENAKSLAEIKAQDTVSIDYQPGEAGKNLAKNITVEKPEAMAPAADEAVDQPAAVEPAATATTEK